MSSITQGILHPDSEIQSDQRLLTQTFTDSLAKSYNARTGGCNIQLAQHLISLALPHLPPPQKETAGVPPTPLRILDNASGPLVLTTEILKTPAITSNHAAIHISAADISADFVAANKSVIANYTPPSSKPTITLDSEVMDAMALAFPPQPSTPASPALPSSPSLTQ